MNTNAQEVTYLTDSTSSIPISIVNTYDLSDLTDKSRLPAAIKKHISTYNYKHILPNHDKDGLPIAFYSLDSIEAVQLNNINVADHLKDAGNTWFFVRFLDKETGKVEQEELIPKPMFDSIVEGVKKMQN